jgi:hypothetical protein
MASRRTRTSTRAAASGDDGGYDGRRVRMVQFAVILEKLAEELVRSQSVTPPGEESRGNPPPALWRLHQLTRRYRDGSTEAQLQQGTDEANAILIGHSFILRVAEFKALVHLFHSSELDPLAPYDPRPGPISATMW